jgi:hypothetical protein
MWSIIVCILSWQGQLVQSRSHISEWIKQIEYVRQKYSDATILFPGHGRFGSAKILLDEQFNYLNASRSLVEQQMQSGAEVGGERAANIPEEGNPDYNPVATLPDMPDYNIGAVAKEISQEK